MNLVHVKWLFVSFFCLLFAACKNNSSKPPAPQIERINLKRGALISCGPDGQGFGEVSFAVSGTNQVKADFNLALSLLHSFEYDEAEKVFAKVIDQQPACAMAYWGVAMSNFHALWAPPTGAELKKGAQAILIAQGIAQKSEREAAYIDALSVFYTAWDTLDHRTRCRKYEQAMENVYITYPADKEAAILYALALLAAADPMDKTFAKQKKAGTILRTLYQNTPGHPGIVHYIIHAYDAPELAPLGLNAARKYAAVAPSSAHALHMPSHIFTRMGLWEECIQSNLASVAAAVCYAQAAGIKGHWDEELHGLDYLMYAYLQQGQSQLAKKQWMYLKQIKEVHPANFKVAYTFAATPSRYVLENRLWTEAASLELPQANFKWAEYPWQKSIVCFTRLLGAIHLGDAARAELALQDLKALHGQLLAQKDAYKADQVNVQVKAGQAWIYWQQGKKDAATRLMTEAADLEDKIEKHPVTPAPVVPARELLGDLLMLEQKWDAALLAYEANLKNNPLRFNGLYGAAMAAEKQGNLAKAKLFYGQLLRSTGGASSGRPEQKRAATFLKAHG